MKRRPEAVSSAVRERGVMLADGGEESSKIGELWSQRRTWCAKDEWVDAERWELSDRGGSELRSSC